MAQTVAWQALRSALLTYVQSFHFDDLWHLSSPNIPTHCTSALVKMHMQPSMFHNNTKSELSIFDMRSKEGSVFGGVLPACHVEVLFPGPFARTQKYT